MLTDEDLAHIRGIAKKASDGNEVAAAIACETAVPTMADEIEWLRGKLQAAEAELSTARRAISWLLLGSCGVSSKTILAAMLGFDMPRHNPGVPPPPERDGPGQQGWACLGRAGGRLGRTGGHVSRRRHGRLGDQGRDDQDHRREQESAGAPVEG